MGYELEHIEAKISGNISFVVSENLNFDGPAFLKDIDEECFKIKQAFRNQVVTFENEVLVRRYFHFHQESLIDLIDTLHNGRETANPVCASVVERLSGLLTYVEQHFPEYFDLDIKMPLVVRDQVNKELSLFRESINGKFGNRNVDIGLMELLKNGWSDFTDRQNAMTFRRFYYIRVLKEGIINMGDNGAGSIETQDVIKVLLHCNYNAPGFFNYLVRYVTWAVSKASTISEKLDQLGYYLKFSNQEYPIVGIAFDPVSPPINVQIAEWISQEIQYLRNKQQLLPSISAEEVVPSEFRLHFDLSVSQVAFLFRAFIEAGVIQNDNTSELIRFLTKYIKTKRAGGLSYESFRIKYYSVESGTKDAVKKVLQSVLNLVSKH